MSWVWLLWTTLLGTWYIYPVWTLPTDAWIAYNGYVFPNVEVIEWSYSSGNFDLSVFDTIRTDWSWYDWAYKTQKTINIRWYIISEDCETLETDIDSMIKACSERFWILQKRRRSWVVTVSKALCSIEFWERRDTSFFMPYTVTITILDPFMYEEDLTEIARENITASMNNNFTLASGNEKPSPFVYILCKSWTSVSSLSVSINDVIITCNTSLVSWNSLLINHKNKEVMKNWLQNFQFSWEFAKLKFWTNNVKVSYTGTLSADIYLMYYPTYA